MSDDIKWSLLFPDSQRIVELLTKYFDHFLDNWWATFSVSVTASIFAIIIALMVSVLALRFRVIDIAIIPFVALSQSFPLQAIAPLILVVLGIGFKSKTIIAFIIAFFPIYGACVTAMKTTPKPLVAHLAICNSNFGKGIWYVRIPAALPAIVSSTKVGFTLAVLGTVVAEFIQPDEGLGSLLLVAQSNYDVDVIYICVSLLIAQGILIYSSLSFFESILIRQRRT